MSWMRFGGGEREGLTRMCRKKGGGGGGKENRGKLWADGPALAAPAFKGEEKKKKRGTFGLPPASRPSEKKRRRRPRDPEGAGGALPSHSMKKGRGRGHGGTQAAHFSWSFNH